MYFFPHHGELENMCELLVHFGGVGVELPLIRHVMDLSQDLFHQNSWLVHLVLENRGTNILINAVTKEIHQEDLLIMLNSRPSLTFLNIKLLDKKMCFTIFAITG